MQAHLRATCFPEKGREKGSCNRLQNRETTHLRHWLICLRGREKPWVLFLLPSTASLFKLCTNIDLLKTDHLALLGALGTFCNNFPCIIALGPHVIIA